MFLGKKTLKNAPLQDFALPNRTVLRFMPEVVGVLSKFGQARANSKEAGGMLFARFADGLISVDHVTTPSPFDFRSRFAFRPSLAHQRNVIMKQFSKGLHFIGEWHTHPQEQPHPSQQDILTARACLVESEHELNAFVVVVLGSNAAIANAWVGIVREEDVQRLQAIARTK